jgi:hypothetical protein
MHASREEIRPAVIPIECGVRSICNRIAQRDHDLGISGNPGIHRIEEVPGSGREGEGVTGLFRAMRARLRRREIGGLHGFGMPGHGTGFAHHMKADGQLAFSIRSRAPVHVVERHGIGPEEVPGLDRHRTVTGKADRAIGAGQEPASRGVHTRIDTIQLQRTRAHHIRKTESEGAAPQVRLQNEPEGLVMGALTGENGLQVGLGDGIADGVRALAGTSPNGGPVVGGLDIHS